MASHKTQSRRISASFQHESVARNLSRQIGHGVWTQGYQARAVAGRQTVSFLIVDAFHHLGQLFFERVHFTIISFKFLRARVARVLRKVNSCPLAKVRITRRPTR